MEWEKILVNDVTDKGLIFKIYKQLIQLKNKNKKQTNQPIKKQAENLNRHFFKEETKMANKHMKRSSTSLITRKMQIKSTMKYNITLVKMVIIRKSRNTKCWRGYGEKGILLSYW